MFVPIVTGEKEVTEIEDLVKAYKFAAENSLDKANFLETHKILSKTLLPIKERGKIRKQQVGVRDSKTMKPVYLAVEPEFVNDEIEKLFADILQLLKKELTPQEIFYYASMIHLWMAKIHPFGDGNGRASRLLEKWFLVSKLGRSAWSINSDNIQNDDPSNIFQN